MRTNNSNYLTLLVIPQDVSRSGAYLSVVDSPTFRAVIEGSSVAGMRCDQILVHRDCDLQSNEFKPWFDRLNSLLVPGGRLQVI